MSSKPEPDVREWSPGEIRALRLRLGHTQAAMASALGYLNAGSVSDLEREVKHPSGPVRRLLDILDGVGCVAITATDPAEWRPAQIRALRVRLDLSQANMADLLGYENEVSVSALERSVGRPVGAARRLLDLLDSGNLDPA